MEYADHQCVRARGGGGNARWGRLRIVNNVFLSTIDASQLCECEQVPLSWREKQNVGRRSAFRLYYTPWGSLVVILNKVNWDVNVCP